MARNNTQNQPQNGWFGKMINFSFFSSVWIVCTIVAKISGLIEEITKSLAQKAKTKAGLP